MRAILGALAVTVAFTGCAPTARYGMLEDPQTGLMWGSAVERNLVVDAAQLENRKVKLTLRNVSGEPSYDLGAFQKRLLDALIAKGYTPTAGDDFGLKLDVNVMYTGHVQSNLAREFAFLGGTAGGVAGYQRSNQSRNAAAGMLAGATLGAIVGSYARDDTYITVAEVTVAVADQYRGSTKKTISFSASPPKQEERPSSIKPFEAVLRTKVAVYAGGRNVAHQQVADGVRQRMVRILADII
jgi:hypothetical protein